MILCDKKKREMEWFYSSNKKKSFIPVVDVLGAVDERREDAGMLDVTLSLCTRRGDTLPKKRCLLYLFKKKSKYEEIFTNLFHYYRYVNYLDAQFQGYYHDP
jgi:hypothetical protein